MDLEVLLEEREIEMKFTSNLEALVLAKFRVSVESLLNPEGEDFLLQQDDGSTMVKHLVRSIVGDTGSEAEESEENAEVFPLPGAPQQLKALALTKRILQAHGLDSSTVLSGLKRPRVVLAAQSSLVLSRLRLTSFSSKSSHHVSRQVAKIQS